MIKRRFGRTGHMSTVAIFGAAAFYDVDQPTADKAVEIVINAGVNHIDVAPSYGLAEERLGPWLKHERDRFFLGCKTLERTKEGAAAELRRSLECLNVNNFDLYQLHSVGTLEELDKATTRGGALEAVIAAREEGLIRYIGITGHGIDAPAVFLEALRRYDFDTVLFPINFIQYANPIYRRNAEELLQVCQKRDVGVMVIKSITKRPWGDRLHNYAPWYEPFDDPAVIQNCINFALSQPITGICTVGDVTLLPIVLDACEKYQMLSESEQEALIETAGLYEPLFA